MVQKISNLLRFENGFEIRDLHHFVSKKVPHIVFRILKVTEIQANCMFKNFQFLKVTEVIDVKK